MTDARELALQDLKQALQTLGLCRGDSVIVHSSFRSVAPVAGGPATVVRALLDTVGPAGNLMFPTFNYTVAPPDTCFDPAGTPCLTGVVAECGRTWQGSVRSAHPTHSVAVIGPDAEALCLDHLAVRAFGIGSPVDRIAKRHGRVLLIGVGNITNSTVHVGEEYAGTPKAPWPVGLPVHQVRLPDGQLVKHQMDTSSSCSSAFGAVEYALRRKGAIRDLRLRASKFQLMRGQEVIDTVGEIIRDKPDVLLCTYPQCGPCSGARRNLDRGMASTTSAAP